MKAIAYRQPGPIDGAGRVRSTLTQTLHPICAATLTEAQRTIESGRARGKIVVEGFAA
jgi:NADPH:quinone reductase